MNTFGNPRQRLNALLVVSLALAACGDVTIKDGTITVVDLPDDCSSVAITLAYSKDGIRRAETLGASLSGNAFGPVPLSPNYLGRTYERDDIKIVVECGGERIVFRNTLAIYVPARGEKEIDTDDFERR
ncbi:MAG: hypothetical protein MJA32_12680 [Proteobacteria bacterium]|nr:hypothetical protein [Pseudomonadota bacterium]